MRKFKFGLFFFLLSCSKIGHAQHLVGKIEICNYWINSHPVPLNCDSLIDQVSYDDRIEAQIRMTIGSLRLRGVDTLLVLVESHPGTLIADTCRASDYPAEVYIFWCTSGKDSLKKNPNKCGLNAIETASSPVFEFFFQYQRQIEREYIMPVIIDARKKGGRIIYNRIISSDIDEYVLYYSIHGVCKRYAFSSADVTNKSSLFYSDNIESQVYKWFLALQKECKKMG